MYFVHYISNLGGTKLDAQNNTEKLGAIETRVSKLEDIVEDIRNELKTKGALDAQMQKTLELMVVTQNSIVTDVKELRTSMMSLVTETLSKSRDDMTTFLKMQEKDEQKEKEHKRQQEVKEQEYLRRAQQGESAFYKKLIIGCFSIFGTIVLSYFGIKSIPSLFN